MKFIYRYVFSRTSLQLGQIDMIEDGIAGSSYTLSSLTKKKGQMIGHPRQFVMIDESNFRHNMVVGGLQRLGVEQSGSLECWGLHKEIVPKSPHPMHVHPGSSILSDEWRAYRGVLTRLGYNHLPVKHNQCFVDPVTGSHAQNLERAWLTYKGQIWRLRGNRTEDLLKQHLKLIEWTYWLGNQHRNGPLGRLFKDIHRKYHL
ncbi:Thymidine kinase [Labeo rohita]|uniref:Thymidine kinase n=1 Tax=Labeo rohita TaxID=84645 RepID=A0ABQ8LKE1_LABRO|nr:Thymidine kinase [Labeo rohita]